MNNTELAELFLTTIYDHAEAKGHHSKVHLDQVAEGFGVTDQSKVYNVAKFLESRNLIKGVYTVGATFALITGEGAVFVERGGDTGIIQKYRSNPTSFIVNINKSTNISGNVSNSVVAPHSSSVLVNISIAADVEGMIAKITDFLRQDHTLSDNQLSDALQDIEALKLQLAKTNKNRSVIESILGTLANISSIGSFVARLSPMIFR